MPNQKLINAGSSAPACTSSDTSFPILNRALYRLDEPNNNFGDYVNTDINSSLRGTSSDLIKGQTDAKFGTSYYFPGTTNDGITFPSSTINTNGGTWSMSAWYKPFSTSAQYYFFSKNFSALGSGYAQFSCTKTSNGFQWNISGSPNQFPFFSCTHVAGWQHVCFTRLQGGQFKGYHNGSLMSGTTSATGTWDSVSSQITFGYEYLRTQPYKGYMDQIRIYNAELTAAQVLLLAQEIC